MKRIKSIVLPLVVLVIVIVISGYDSGTTAFLEKESTVVNEEKQIQNINMFVTHGHCSTPFAGVVEDLKVNVLKRVDGGNPLEGLKISFATDPNSFNACAGDDLTDRIKTPGLFIGANNESITFESTDIYTMGVDWYQVNGKLSIKGVEKDVKFFATGIRNPKESMSSSLVLGGQFDLLDWGIDYDKIVTGKSDPVPTKWMYVNMKIDLASI